MKLKYISQLFSLGIIASLPILSITSCSDNQPTSATVTIGIKHQHLLSMPGSEYEIASLSFEKLSKDELGKLNAKFVNESNEVVKYGSLKFSAEISTTSGSVALLFPSKVNHEITNISLVISVGNIEIGRSEKFNISTTDNRSVQIDLNLSSTANLKDSTIDNIAYVSMIGIESSDDIEFVFADKNNIVDTEIGTLSLVSTSEDGSKLSWTSGSNQLSRSLKIIARSKNDTKTIGQSQIFTFSVSSFQVTESTVTSSYFASPNTEIKVGDLTILNATPGVTFGLFFHNSNETPASAIWKKRFSWDQVSKKLSVFLTLPIEQMEKEWLFSVYIDGTKIYTSQKILFSNILEQMSWSDVFNNTEISSIHSFNYNEISSAAVTVEAPKKNTERSMKLSNTFSYIPGTVEQIVSFGGSGQPGKDYPNWKSPAEDNSTLQNFVFDFNTTTWSCNFFDTGVGLEDSKPKYYGFFAGCSVIDKIILDLENTSSDIYSFFPLFDYSYCSFQSAAPIPPALWIKNADVAQNIPLPPDGIYFTEPFNWFKKCDINGQAIEESALRNIIIPDSLSKNDFCERWYISEAYKNIVIHESEAGIN